MKLPKQSVIHLWLTGFWVALAIPTVLWWRESVFWVSIMSLYAIISNHWTAISAAKAKESAERVEESQG